MAVMFKDVTSFSQGATDRTPRTFVAEAGDLRIVVTRHIDYPGQWVLQCDPFFRVAINDCTAQYAQCQVLNLLKKHLTACLKALKG